MKFTATAAGIPPSTTGIDSTTVTKTSFKDRHYFDKDWGHYFSADDEDEADGKVVFEVGCGTGNTIFPLVTRYPKLFVHACDFSPHPITLIKIFMLSAVSPEKMPFVIQNLKEVLKPKGFILLRDYATGDFAQVKLQQRNQMISENYFFQGDGTCFESKQLLQGL